MPAADVRPDACPARWAFALGGLFVLVVAVVALSGPGRMDIIDGQPRYEVARSLVEHGDPAVRDPGVWFCVLPGRGGQRYSLYRLPQSLAGVPAILLADATGPVGEARRQFFFSMTGAVAAGALAVAYALWFRRLGHAPRAALAWALGGVFCTPTWFYGTSSFDDILGTAAVVGALALAWYGLEGRRALFAGLAGLALGLAFNCKQPLGLFVVPVLVLALEGPDARRARLARAGLVVAGLGLGVLVYAGYEWYKFPPGSTEGHAEILAQYVPAWPGTPVAAVLGLLLSPAAGAFWYCPPLVVALAGLGVWWRARRGFTAGLAFACLGFFAFICSLVIFKGDLSWGPRYLTPVFAALWVFVPAGAAARPRPLVASALGLGVVVQLLGLSVDFHRLYVELRFPSGFYHGNPWVYFHPRVAHLVNRPREVVEILSDDGSATTAFAPTRLPTEATPCPEFFERGPEAVRKYRFLNSLRPWWASQRWLPPEQRPVALGPTALLLLACAGAGALLMPLAPRARPPGPSPGPHPPESEPFALRGVPCPMSLIARLKQAVPVRWREKAHAGLNRCRAPFLPEPYRTVLPFTMVGLERLRSLDRLARRVDELAVPGDVVECGTCNGGSAAVLARVACRSPHGRHTWLLDSFAGLPPAGPRDGPHAAEYTGRCHGAAENVREVLRRVGVHDSAVTLVPGWFHETLPTLPVTRIALLHVDADWHDSVRQCLDHLYDRVSPGGFVVFDDFGYWEGCRAAWEGFKSERNLSVGLTDVDGIGAFFQKPAPGDPSGGCS